MGSSSRPFRIVVLGATGAGKTALVQQLMFGNHVIFEEESGPKRASVSDVYDMCVMADRGTMERVQVFDTPGHLFEQKSANSVRGHTQEHFLTIADAFILVFSITVQSSYTQVENLWQLIALRSKDIPIVVVGMKADLTRSRTVEKEAVFAWAHSHWSEYFECTVADRTSLVGPFAYLITKLASGKKLSTSNLSLAPPLSPNRSVREGSSLELISSDGTDTDHESSDPVTATCLPQPSALLSCLGMTTKK